MLSNGGNFSLNDIADNDQNVLSKTLERKFLELENITQRLRLRLFDVTGDADIDPDDQFESDLNTIPAEDDNYEMLKEHGLINDNLDWIQSCQYYYDNQNQIDGMLQNCTSDNKATESIDTIDEILKMGDNSENILIEKLENSIIINDEQNELKQENESQTNRNVT